MFAFAGVASGFRRFVAYLPRGGRLLDEPWAARHRGVLILLFAHAVGLAAFGLYMGAPLQHALVEGGIVGFLAAVASVPALGRRFRTAVASFGLVASSAILVHFSGGYIEAHFHFFVMMGVVALYQDWVPFSIAVLFVALHHGTVGVFDPQSVYNHAAAFGAPWTWALIHAVLLLGLCVANIVTWRASENALDQRDAVVAENQRNVSVLAATLESTADGILVVDKDGRIAGSNRRFVEMWRIPESVLASRDDGAAIAHVLDQLQDPAGFTAKVRDLYADPDAESFDVLEFKDGRFFERYSLPQRIGGQSVGRVWSFRDVTERRQAERDLVESVARLAELDHLKEMDEFKSRFINSAAHELNTPLTPMRIQLHLLERDKTGKLTPTQEEAIRILHRNFERFDRLVQDVLASARIQAGRLGITKSPVALDSVVKDAVRSFEEHAKQAGIELEPRIEAGLHVSGDAERFTQVIYNLLGNAVKFTPRGGRIVVEAARGSGEALVKVRDSGTGMTREQVEKLFQPFSQVHDIAKTKAGGSGLGLYISRGIMDLHGGRIWCESPGPGKGSTFAFAVPLDT